jgi:hypothetical protein
MQGKKNYSEKLFVSFQLSTALFTCPMGKPLPVKAMEYNADGNLGVSCLIERLLQQPRSFNATIVMSSASENFFVKSSQYSCDIARLRADRQ